ncbi:MAG: ATP-binding protein [Candidatus Acidiferrum sp.]|jgi:hypothetical protein
MLIGREQERAKLYEAVCDRRSLLVSGPAGSGKSALLEEVLSSLAASIRGRLIFCSVEGPPNTIWQHLVLALGAAGDPDVLVRAEREAGSRAHLGRWIKAQTSLRLRGILRRAARSREYSIFLDAKDPLPDGVYRLLQEWVWSRRTPVVLLARGATQTELGKASRLYWHDGLRLTLGPLAPASAEILLEHAIARFQLASFADGDFRSFVLEQSARFPSGIVRLCELASDAAYHSSGRLKLHTLAIDFMLQQRRTTERAALHA